MPKKTVMGGCSRCGAVAPGGVRICFNCGARLEEDASSTGNATKSFGIPFVGNIVSSLKARAAKASSSPEPTDSTDAEILDQAMPAEPMLKEEDADEIAIPTQAADADTAEDLVDEPVSPLTSDAVDEPLPSSLASVSMDVDATLVTDDIRSVQEPAQTSEQSVREDGPMVDEAPSVQLSFPRVIVEDVEPQAAGVMSWITQKKKNCVVLLVTSVLLLLLAFCPFVRVRVVLFEQEETLRCTIADTVVLAGASLVSLSDEQLQDLDLYWEQQELAEAIVSAESPWEQRQLYADYVKTTVLLHEMQERTRVTMTLLLTGALGVMYVLLCARLVWLCVRALWKENLAQPTASAQAQGLYRKASTLLLFLLFLLPLMCFLMLQAYYVDKAGVIPQLAIKTTSAAWGFVLSLIVAVVGSVYAAMTHMEDVKKRNRGYLPPKTKQELLRLICVPIFILSLFLPCLTVELTDTTSRVDSQSTQMLTVVDIQELTARDVGIYTDYIAIINAQRVQGLITNIQNTTDPAKQNAMERELLNATVFGCGRYQLRALYIAIVLLTSACFLSMACLVRKVYLHTLLGKDQSKSIKRWKILSLVLSIAHVLLLTALVVFAKLSLFGDLQAAVDFGLGFGPFVTLAAAVCLVILLRTKTEHRLDRAYDNPDISYAPYVVGYERQGNLS